MRAHLLGLLVVAACLPPVRGGSRAESRSDADSGYDARQQPPPWFNAAQYNARDERAYEARLQAAPKRAVGDHIAVVTLIDAHG